MKIIEPSATIIDELDGGTILKKIENAARTCYQSFDKVGDGTAEKLISNCIKRGHESILEHVSISVRFVTDRAIHNEMVRHRLTSVSCESTRYCRYEDGIDVIRALCFDGGNIEWKCAMVQAEQHYVSLMKKGFSPQDARSVLPLSLKCEYIITANLREWRHIFKLRCSPAAHPEMRRVMIPLLRKFQEKVPVIFDDVEVID